MSEDLFSHGMINRAPLAHRMRPRSFREFVGQEHLPDELNGRKYYTPKGIGFETKILEWLSRAGLKKTE